MGRRGIKEYKAGQALEVILADRNREPVKCPSCGHGRFERSPRKRLNDTPGELYRQVRLTCRKCERSAAYMPTQLVSVKEPELV